MLKWLQLRCERICEAMLSSLIRDGAFTIAGRPGLFFQGFEGMLPWPEGMAEAEGTWEEWQWRPGEEQGLYELMRRSLKMEDVPAETPQSRLDQQSERDYEFEDEVRRRSRGVASSSLDEVSDAETLIMGPGGEVTGKTNRAEEVTPEP